MKNFLIIVLLISWSVLSDDETMHKDHESMQMMDHMHHSEHHSSAPVGTTGNMHHMGWMVSVKQGFMNMSGNILDGDILQTQISCSYQTHGKHASKLICYSRRHGHADDHD